MNRAFAFMMGGAPLMDPSRTSTPASHWWRPDSGLELAVGDTVVASMADRIGTMHQRQPGTDAAKPIFIPADAAYGGKPVLGGDHGRFFYGDEVSAIAPPVSLLWVGHKYALGHSSLASVFNAAPYNLLWLVNSNTQIEFYVAAGGIRGPAAAAESPGAYLYTDDGTQGLLYANNFTTPIAASSSVGRWLSTTHLDLFAPSAGIPALNGKFAEAAIWRHVLSAPDRTGLASYLQSWFGVPASV